MPAAWRLYYDSDCAFCTRMMRRAGRWAESKGQPLTPQPLNGPDAAAKGYGDALVLEADRVYLAGDAWLKLVGLAPWYLRAFSWLGRFATTRAMVGGVYRVVARHRPCQVPSR